MTENAAVALWHGESVGDDIRTLIRGGEVWFVAADIAKILAITDVTRAVRRLDDDEKSEAKLDTATGERPHLIVSEPGMYRLVLNSRSPLANKLRRWLTHEVLPSIRSKGAYLTEQMQEALVGNWIRDRNTAMSSATDYKMAKSMRYAASREPYALARILDADAVEAMVDKYPDAAVLAAQIRQLNERFNPKVENDPPGLVRLDGWP